MTVPAITAVDNALDALYAKFTAEPTFSKIVWYGPQQPKGNDYIFISANYENDLEPQAASANNPWQETFDLTVEIGVQRSAPDGVWRNVRTRAGAYALTAQTIIHNDQFLSNTVERAYVAHKKRNVGFSDEGQMYQFVYTLTVRCTARAF